MKILTLVLIAFIFGIIYIIMKGYELECKLIEKNRINKIIEEFEMDK